MQSRPSITLLGRRGWLRDSTRCSMEPEWMMTISARKNSPATERQLATTMLYLQERACQCDDDLVIAPAFLTPPVLTTLLLHCSYERDATAPRPRPEPLAWRA